VVVVGVVVVVDVAVVVGVVDGIVVVSKVEVLVVVGVVVIVDVVDEVVVVVVVVGSVFGLGKQLYTTFTIAFLSKVSKLYALENNTLQDDCEFFVIVFFIQSIRSSPKLSMLAFTPS